MPGMFPGRPGGVRDEPLLDMLMERRPIPPGAPLHMHDVARMLTAAAGPAEPGELAGEAVALAAFTRQVSPAGISHAASRPARRWRHARPARRRLPITAALVAGVAGLGSIAAAYLGVLPGPIQNAVHDGFGVPAASAGAHKPGTTLQQGADRDHDGGDQSPAPSPASSSSHGNASSQPSQHARKYGTVPRATCTPQLGLPQRGSLPHPSTSVPGYGGWTPPPTGSAGCEHVATPTVTPRR